MAIVLILVIFLAFTAENNCDTSIQLSERQSSFVLLYHNAIRRHYPSTAMKYMKYNDTLANDAREAAGQCTYENSISGMNYYAGPGQLRPQLFRAINWWWREWSSYNYNRNQCAAARTCTHFLQLVNNSTEQFGCGMAVCADIKNTTLPVGGHVIVCKYDPAGPASGNVPYEKPSIQNRACSKCGDFGDDYLCKNDFLCGLLDISGSRSWSLTTVSRS